MRRDRRLSTRCCGGHARGRINTLFSATVFKLRSDLRRELDDVCRRLPDDRAGLARDIGRPPLGIATDGATFIAHETCAAKLRGAAGRDGAHSDRDRVEDFR
jgi:hypothetical protein